VDFVDDDFPSEPHEADTDELLDTLTGGVVQHVITNEAVVTNSGTSSVVIRLRLIGGSMRQVQRELWYLKTAARERGGVFVCDVEPEKGTASIRVRLSFWNVDNFVRAREILNSLLDG
jgi:hypothetical protein